MHDREVDEKLSQLQERTDALEDRLQALEAPPVVFLGPDVIALVRAARDNAESDYNDASEKQALIKALKPFEGVE